MAEFRRRTAALPAISGPRTLAADHLVPAAELERAKDYARARHADATRKAYISDFAIFAAWAQPRGLATLPASPVAVAAFIAAEADAGRAVSTLERRLAAIRYAHVMAGLEPPTVAESVRATLAGVRRTRRVRPNRKAPATTDLLTRLIGACDDDLRGLRDRALLLLGFAGAFRRSELCAIELGHLTHEAAGCRIFLAHSKGDQDGKGVEVAILRGATHCPLAALDAWLAAVGITEGPVFRGVLPGDKISNRALDDRNVALIVKRRCQAASIDPADFAGHSLRAGFLTSAAEAGASIFAMKEVSRHKSLETLSFYIRRADAFKNHAGKGLL